MITCIGMVYTQNKETLAHMALIHTYVWGSEAFTLLFEPAYHDASGRIHGWKKGHCLPFL